MKVLIVPDKFKGTLSAHRVAAAIARGWRRARPADQLELLPMSDGGDGFGEVVGNLLQAKAQVIDTCNAARRGCRVKWWWEPKNRIAVIESARVIGLAMLTARRFHPFDLDSYGLGAVLQAAAAKGARHCIMGIGGSATNDGGFGLGIALGWKFLDHRGRPIDRWTGLDRLESVMAPARPIQFDHFQVAVDVQNRLLGARGATRVYGPQKGLKPRDFKRAERALEQLARVFRRDFGENLAMRAGAGAAGGLGFGLMAFAGGDLVPGFELFEQYAGLGRRLGWADLVLTGEGAIDRSTLMGKGVGQVAARCRKLGVGCLGFAGQVRRTSGMAGIFSKTYGLTELTSLAEAEARPAFWLSRLSAQAAISIEATVSAG